MPLYQTYNTGRVVNFLFQVTKKIVKAGWQLFLAVVFLFAKGIELIAKGLSVLAMEIFKKWENET